MTNRPKSKPSRSGLACCLGLAVATAGICFPAAAQEATWTLGVQPAYVVVSGHDRPVVDVAATSGERLDLETEASSNLRLEIRLDRGRWAFGAETFICFTSQEASNRTLSAASPSQSAEFRIPERSYVSTGPDEELYYRLLGDTDLEVWTFDLYAGRRLGERDWGELELRFGLRLGDFDNDYHGVIGVLGEGGTQLDASSNYDLMMGPILGLATHMDRGAHSFQALFGQSLIFGNADLSRTLHDFAGAHPPESFSSVEREQRFEDVEIPISDLRLRWSFRLSDHWSTGLGAVASIWWDVPVPPGVEPGGELYQENTITFYSLFAVIELEL